MESYTGFLVEMLNGESRDDVIRIAQIAIGFGYYNETYTSGNKKFILAPLTTYMPQHQQKNLRVRLEQYCKLLPEREVMYGTANENHVVIKVFARKRSAYIRVSEFNEVNING